MEINANLSALGAVLLQEYLSKETFLVGLDHLKEKFLCLNKQSQKPPGSIC